MLYLVLYLILIVWRRRSSSSATTFRSQTVRSVQAACQKCSVPYRVPKRRIKLAHVQYCSSLSLQLAFGP